MTQVLHFCVYLLTLLIGLTIQFMQLPDGLARAWPQWSMLLLAAWALNEPELPHLLLALLLGLATDVMLGCPLGQHAVGLLLTTYLAARARPVLAQLPWWQTTIALAPLWAGFALLMTIGDRLAHHPAEPALRWWPVVAAVVLWPLVNLLVADLARRRGPVA